MAKRRLQVSVALDRDLLAKIDRIAAALNQSRSQTLHDLLADVIESAEQQAKLISNPTVMSAFQKALSAPGVLAAMGKAMGEELDAKKAGEVLDFFKEVSTPKASKKKGKKRGHRSE